MWIKPGDSYNPRTMDAGVQRVERYRDPVVYCLDKGYGDNPLTSVRVCSRDYWSIRALAYTCPVSRLLTDWGTDNSLPMSWRVEHGIPYPEDLRREFREDVLDTWRKAMLCLFPALRLTGMPGEVYSSEHEVLGTEPVGDHVVVGPEERDGVPMYGLVVPGGSPLLQGVVRVVPQNL